jgi:glyoxylase-like metal-dependent hydrolase (beta-lactamase superfamily II)
MNKNIVMETQALKVQRLGVGSYGNNVYLVQDRLQGCCVLIDAAAEGNALLQAIGSDRLAAIILTHAHIDHTLALKEVRKKTGAPVGIHPLEPETTRLHPEISLSDGYRIAVGSHELEVLHTPGHTPGSISLFLPSTLCFCGDTVFPGGPGKTWSPESFQTIIQSLERKIYTLPPNVLLLPGHGEGIRVGDSKKEYERFQKRPREKTPFGDVLWEES